MRRDGEQCAHVCVCCAFCFEMYGIGNPLSLLTLLTNSDNLFLLGNPLSLLTLLTNSDNLFLLILISRNELYANDSMKLLSVNQLIGMCPYRNAILFFLIYVL